MHGLRLAAVLAATMAVAPALASLPTDPAEAAAKKKCKKGTVLIFLDPGTHTIALDAPATVPGLDGFQTIGSTAHYSLTFERVNEDGSRYTG